MVAQQELSRGGTQQTEGWEVGLTNPPMPVAKPLGPPFCSFAFSLQAYRTKEAEYSGRVKELEEATAQRDAVSHHCCLGLL